MHGPLRVRCRSLAVLFSLCLAASAAPSSADVWDNDPTNADDSSATKNELFHGDVQVHDIAAQGGNPDEDWFAILSRPFSSYEVLASGFQGQLWGGASGGVLFMDRVLATGTVLDPGSPPPGGLGGSRSVRWTNNTASQVTDFIRVDGGETMCAINCTTDAQYTIRMRETTGAISRFNNAGSQVTTLILQNPTDYSIVGTVYFWDASGTQSGSQPFLLLEKAVFVLNTATVVPGVSGSITITQNGRFGDLQGKSVAVEPATGFSFDTPMVYRPH